MILSCSSRKECYELDFCYDQNQGNDFMFIKEVKPLISGLLRGCNATIIACGARATGKTRLIQVPYCFCPLLFLLFSLSINPYILQNMHTR